MGALGILAAWLVVGVVGATATVLWVRRLWKRKSELPVWTRAVAGMMVASAMFAALGTVVGLVKAFGAVGAEAVDPSQKARILAEGISTAMNCTAFGLLVWLPSVVVVTLLLRKRPKAAG